MSTLARGAALVDASGNLVTAEPGFLRELGLPPGSPAAALGARAAAEPELRDLLEGRGPDGLALPGPGGEPLRLERHAGPAGLLLVLRADGDPALLEHAVLAQGLAALAGGLSHDVNGPLHAMTLQLALLAGKLGDEPAGRQAVRHLEALRDQVARIHHVVRRFREVVEPPAEVGGLNLARLTAELAASLAHDLQRRGLRLVLADTAGAVRTVAPPEQTVRLVLGLLLQAAATTPSGGALEVAVTEAGGWASITLDHPLGARGPDLGYESLMGAGAAAALGGRLARSGQEGREHVTLQLPRGQVG